jgi:hypothetical protein
MRTIRGLLVVTIFGGLVLAGWLLPQASGEKKGETRVFEMRTYYAAPGKMAALHQRFSQHTCKLFAKHGITIVGFWVPTDPQGAENKLVYIVAFPSKEAADKSWKAFRADPVWIEVKKKTEAEGPLLKKDGIVSEYLNPTDYSPIK